MKFLRGCFRTLLYVAGSLVLLSIIFSIIILALGFFIAMFSA